MFNFFRKKSSPPIPSEPLGYLLGADMHAHLVPGVDDGAPDVAASVALVRGLHALGYSKLIATPHIYWDLYKNTLETLAPACDALNKTLSTELPGMEISLAAEYMMDDYFEKLLSDKAQLLTVQGNRVLVEMPFSALSLGWKEMLFELQMNGYQPILAHPERYNYAHGNKELFHEWKDAGCELQVNLLSIDGYYGPDVQSAARYLLKENLVTFAGTDCHHDRHLSNLGNPSIARAIAGYDGLLNKTLL